MNNKIDTRALELEVYIAKYMVPVIEKKLFFVLLFIICFFIFFILSQFIKPEYSSQATILVEEPESFISSKVSRQLVSNKAGASYILAEAEKLKSNTFQEEVLKILPEEVKKDLQVSLDFSDHIKEGIKHLVKTVLGEKGTQYVKKILGRKPAPVSDYQEKIQFLRSLNTRVDIKTKANSGLIWISAIAFNSEMAPILIKSYIDVWMALNLEKNKGSIQKEWMLISKQRREAFQKLSLAESELIEFKRRYDIPSEQKIVGDVELQMEMDKLQSKLKRTSERYTFLDRLVLETKRKEGGIKSNLQIISPPVVPTYPSKSIGRLFVLTGVIGGLFIGIILCLAHDISKGIIRHESDVEDPVKLPIVGHIPRI